MHRAGLCRADFYNVLLNQRRRPAPQGGADVRRERNRYDHVFDRGVAAAWGVLVTVVGMGVEIAHKIGSVNR